MTNPIISYSVQATITALVYRTIVGRVGQFLVVKYFKLASNYQRPELIPDPLATGIGITVNGSGISLGDAPQKLKGYIMGRDNSAVMVR